MTRPTRVGTGRQLKNSSWERRSVRRDRLFEVRFRPVGAA
jgi:hypothetical protein